MLAISEEVRIGERENHGMPSKQAGKWRRG